VIWPSPFARALEAMSLLSLDFTTFAGGLCFFDMSFYQVDFFIALGFAIDLIPA
jgi:hypothetical protein